MVHEKPLNGFGKFCDRETCHEAVSWDDSNQFTHSQSSSHTPKPVHILPNRFKRSQTSSHTPKPVPTLPNQFTLQNHSSRKCFFKYTLSWRFCYAYMKLCHLYRSLHLSSFSTKFKHHIACNFLHSCVSSPPISPCIFSTNSVGQDVPLRIWYIWSRHFPVEASQWILSWASLVYFTSSQSIPVVPILILLSQLRLVIPSGLLSLPLLCTVFRISDAYYYSIHPPWRNDPENIRWRIYKMWT